MKKIKCKDLKLDDWVGGLNDYICRVSKIERLDENSIKIFVGSVKEYILKDSDDIIVYYIFDVDDGICNTFESNKEPEGINSLH